MQLVGLKKASRNGTIHFMITDITKEFSERTKPKDGKIVFSGNYDRRTHAKEIEMAEWLMDEFGGNIILLAEVKRKGVKTPDCIWKHKNWGFKDIYSDKYGTIDKRIHKAYLQIESNPGGMVLDFTNGKLSLGEAVAIVRKSLQQRGKDNFKVIIKKSGEYKVFKITKE